MLLIVCSQADLHLVYEPVEVFGKLHLVEWFALIRRHAEVVVDDELIIHAFRKYCKRRPPVDERLGSLNVELQKQHNCIPDEHYLPTLLAMTELEEELERRTITYTQWTEFAASKTQPQGWHPVTFSYSDATPKRIQEIKDINHVYYGTEFRAEWCRSNSTSVPCFTFARKFSQGAAMRLLREGFGGDFDPSLLMDQTP